MLFELLLAIVLGVCFGVLTGLTPGLHINLVNVGVLALSFVFLSYVHVLTLIVFIIAMSITHTFTDSIPSIYLGAPDADHVLSALPGHKLLIEGKGHTAVVCTIIGSFGALLLCALFLPIVILAMSFLQHLISPFIGYILIGVMCYILFLEKTWMKRSCALALFLISGILGIITFSLYSLTQPLFALLSGLFGLSILIPSLFSSSTLSTQHTTSDVQVPAKEQFFSISFASFMGFITGFLPGFGSSQAALLAVQWLEKQTPEHFLILTGGINTANMLISLATAYTLSKARNGSIVTILELIDVFTFQVFFACACAAILAGSIACVVTIFLSRLAARLINIVPYKFIVFFICLVIVITCFFFDGILGLSVLSCAVFIGFLAHLLSVGKHYLMGCLLCNVILYFIL